MYVRFCKRERWIEIPGRDGPWHISAVDPYLRWRASRNNSRSIAQIKSKLKHCGLCYDYLLPTAKGIQAAATTSNGVEIHSKEPDKAEESERAVNRTEAGSSTGEDSG